jgi:hypothetical protein
MLAEPIATTPQKSVQPLSSFFRRVEEIVKRLWKYISAGFKVLFAGGGFLFFRAIEWIHPMYVLRAETIYLRLLGLKQFFGEKTAKQKYEELLIQHEVLQKNFAASELTKMAVEDEFEVLKSTHETLASKHQTLESQSALQEKEIALLLKKQTANGQERIAQHGYGKLIEGEKQKLKAEVAKLNAALAVAIEEKSSATKKVEGLENEVSSLSQKVTDLKVAMQEGKNLEGILAKIASARGKIQYNAKCAELGLFLVEQIKEKGEKLKAIMALPSTPPSARVHLKGLVETIFPALTEHVGTTVPLVKSCNELGTVIDSLLKQSTSLAIRGVC